MQVPPTPLLPTRIGGWSLEDESLLMDQRPIFGDESMLEMTFEMSRVEDGDCWNGDGLDIGDESTDTIVAATVVDNRPKTRMDDIETAREAVIQLDRLDTIRFLDQQDAEITNDLFSEDDFYGDYPPSPFLHKSVRVRKSESYRPVMAVEEVVNPPAQSDIGLRRRGSIPDSPVHVVSGSVEFNLEKVVPEETQFSDRGERPTWAEKEARSSQSREASFAASESGSEAGNDGRGETSKRPATSPCKRDERKKSKIRSPSGDDFYARRLSRSISSASTPSASQEHQIASKVLPRISRQSASSSSSQNARAGPSRLGPGSDAGTKSSKSMGKQQVTDSPAIHASVQPPMPVGDEDDVPPARPSLLSRLIARSSILRAQPANLGHHLVNPSSVPPSPIVQTISTDLKESTGAPPVSEFTDICSEVEEARSRRASGSASGQPIWDGNDMDPGDELAEDRVGRSPSHSMSRRSSRYYDDLSDTLACDLSATNDTSIISISEHRRPLPMKNGQDRSASLTESPSMSHSLPIAHPDMSASTSSHRSLRADFLEISQIGGDISLRQSLSSHNPTSVPESPVLSSTSDPLSSSLKADSENGNSIHRSTSQRVIGFFSDLIRSTSSRSGSDDIQTPTLHQSSSSLGEAATEQVIDQERENYDDHIGEEGSDEGYAVDDGHNPANDSHSAIRGLPAAPRYIPLTRPNKAPVSHTALRAGNPIRRPRPAPVPKAKLTGTSSFASAALARLPPPGKGSSSSGEKIIVKPLERAKNLQDRRALFEKSRNQPIFPTVPGKAKSHEGVGGRLEEKKRMKEAEERNKRIEEDRAYRNSRKETVVKARPVPEMYRRKL